MPDFETDPFPDLADFAGEVPLELDEVDFDRVDDFELLDFDREAVDFVFDAAPEAREVFAVPDLVEVRFVEAVLLDLEEPPALDPVVFFEVPDFDELPDFVDLELLDPDLDPVDFFAAAIFTSNRELFGQAKVYIR